jgi:hypothetical protein
MRKFGKGAALALVLAMSGCTASAPIAFANQVRIGPAKPAKPCPPFWLYSFGKPCR